MKVEFDRNACSGWFQCVQEWDSFEMNMTAKKADLKDADEREDGHFVLETPTRAEEAAKSAAESCPIDAIRVLNDDGEQIYP